jgi:hypothetical protein
MDTTPLPSRPISGGGEGRSVGSSGLSGRASNSACRLDEGFESCPTKCITKWLETSGFGRGCAAGLEVGPQLVPRSTPKMRCARAGTNCNSRRGCRSLPGDRLSPSFADKSSVPTLGRSRARGGPASARRSTPSLRRAGHERKCSGTGPRVRCQFSQPACAFVGAKDGRQLGSDRRREVQSLLVLVVGDSQVEGPENLDKLLFARGGDRRAQAGTASSIATISSG